jgi:GNAT superfamily N-acetyltransferase
LRGYPSVLPTPAGAFFAGSRVTSSFVALLDGEIIGQVSTASAVGDPAEGVWTSALGCSAERLCVLKRLLVDPRREGMGAGRSLLEVAVAAAHAEGLWPVLDVVDRRSRALRLYLRAGWRDVGGTNVPAAPGGDCAGLAVRCLVGPPPPAGTGRAVAAPAAG